MDKRLNHWRDLLPEIILLVLLGVLFAWNAGAFEIDPYSEIFHIVSAKQSLHAGRFWVPVLNGHDYLLRAPFWTWIVTFFFKLFGSTLLAARIPAILFALGGVALTYLITLELTANRIASLFASLILGTSWGYFHLGTLSTADILTTNLYLGYFWTLLKWHKAASRRNQILLELNIYSAIFGLLLGTLLLVKGGLSAVLLILIGIAYLALNQSLFLLSKLNLQLLSGVLLAMVLPWLLWTSIVSHNAAFAMDYFVLYPFQRIMGTGHWHGLQWDPLFYLKRLPADLLPYLLFIPAALLECLMPRRWATSPFQTQTEPWVIWLLVWFLGGLAAYSCCAFQEPSLLLPFYPAVAILIGHYLGRSSEGVMGSELYKTTIAVYILTLMAVAVLCSIIIFQVLPSDYVKGFWHLPGKPVIEFFEFHDHRIDLQEAFPLWKFWMIPGPFILLLGGLTLYVLHVLRRATAGSFAILGTSLLFLLFVKAIYLPILHRPVPERFAQLINQKATSKDTVALYSLHPDIKRVLFYLDDKKLPHTYVVRNDAEFQKTLTSSSGTVYGVIREKSFFNDIDYNYRNLLRINQFNWKWDMTRLGELKKLLVVRQPMFNKMKSDMLYFQSIPSSSIRELQAEIGVNSDPFAEGDETLSHKK